MTRRYRRPATHRCDYRWCPYVTECCHRQPSVTDGSPGCRRKNSERTKGFPHYNPMGAICCHGNQIRSSPKLNAVTDPNDTPDEI